MKIYLWIIGILLSIGIGVLIWMTFFQSEAPPPQGSGPLGFPVASSTTAGSGISSGQPTILITLRDGASSMEINDFLHNGTTVEDVQNPGNYYLAGNLGYCLKDGVCPTGAPTAHYKVTYSIKEHFFTIALTDEPLGVARLGAQQFLMQALGMSQQQLCDLNYYLGTTSYVNSIYAGKNLGFSFCPGATA